MYLTMIATECYAQGHFFYALKVGHSPVIIIINNNNNNN